MFHVPRLYPVVLFISVGVCVLKNVIYYLPQAVAKKMISGEYGGAIVNVSSQASQKALKDHTLYCEWPRK